MARAKKRVLSAVAVLLSLAALTGCGVVHRVNDHDSASSTGTGASAHDLLPATIRSTGKVVVATDPTYPPFESLSADQKTIVGLDPDLMHALAQRLGITAEFARAGFDTIIPGLQADRYDLAMSGMNDTRQRQAQVSFVDYISVGGAVVMAKGDKLANQAVTPQSLCGLSVGVQTGTVTIPLSQQTSAQCASSGKPAIKLSTFPSVPSALLALSSGRIDYVWTDAVSGATQAKQSGGRFVSVSDGTTPPCPGSSFPSPRRS